MKGSSNELWKFVNHVQGKRIKDPLTNLLSEYNSIDDLLQAKFTENFNSVPTSTTEIENGARWEVDISLLEAKKLFLSLSELKALGHDGIPNKIYKYLADVIAEPLQLIFKTSILEQSVPAAWKKSKIIPIPKTVPANVQKMRYITLLPASSNILEKILLRENWSNFETAFGNE